MPDDRWQEEARRRGQGARAQATGDRRQWNSREKTKENGHYEVPDDRWLDSVEQDFTWQKKTPGARAYGSSRAEAISNVEALVLRIVADRVDNGGDLLAYAGIFRHSREESARIIERIDRDCGQVRKEDWRESGGRG